MAETALQGGEKAKILALFRRFDDAGSGTLDEERIRAVLAALDPAGLAAREGAVSRLLARVGPAPAGKVHYEALLELLWEAEAGPPAALAEAPPPPAAEGGPEAAVHGVLVVGRRGCGKTSLALSLLAQAAGAYPSRKDPEIQAKRSTMVATGQPYELPVCERTSTSIGRTVVVDTPPYGHGARSERPLRPQGTRIPQWLSIVLNAHGLQSKAVVLTVDGTDTPLWEDDAHCADIAALIAALRRESVGVSVAVTKLGRQREIALYDASHGKHHGGQVGRDPRSGYETFASRYVEKVGAALRAKVSRIDDAAEELEQPSFLCAGKTIFDVPTWSGADEFKSWQQKRGTAEPPNFSYATARLRRLLQSTSEQAPPASASARL